MQTAIVSDHLCEWLRESTVIAAVFTTYTFDPEFFELEVVPLLLPKSIQYSTDARVKQVQVREKLRESGLQIEVFLDRKICQQECSASPGMEYLFHGIHRGNSAFHPKVTLILSKDRNEGMRLLVGAGSNNLTRAGWWDNIECLHWEEVRRDGAPRQLVEQFRDDVRWLMLNRKFANEGSGSALDQIEGFLGECRVGAETRSVAYYPMNRLTERSAIADFPKFIGEQAELNLTGRDWTLEIISPFFADDPGSHLHDSFLPPRVGVEKIHLLLPMDGDGNALCQKEYYEHIDTQEQIHWSQWRDDVAKRLGVRQKDFRRLHAKLYHFYNGRQAWAFVGSVNFSHKAMGENSEAGFFLCLNQVEPLLEPVPKRSVHKFSPSAEFCPGNDQTATGSGNLPQISLVFDWKEELLQGVCETGESYEINILGAEGDPVVTGYVVTEKRDTWNGDVTELKKLLASGSLVKLSGDNVPKKESFPDHTVMLLQKGWTHKPLDNPILTPAQILAIYACLSPERRELMVYRELVRKFAYSDEPGDITHVEDDDEIKQFFCEYAEIFHAFRELRKRLTWERESDNRVLLDYYLTGTGMDSLRTLLDRIDGKDAQLDSVTEYLILLCASEIYENAEFGGDRLCEEQLTRTRARIESIKSDGLIQLPRRSLADGQKFFKWFEQQFHKQYRLTAADEA